MVTPNPEYKKDSTMDDVNKLSDDFHSMQADMLMSMDSTESIY